MSHPPVTALLWSAAFAPVALLFVLVVTGRVRTHVAAAAVLGLALALGAGAFGAGGTVLAVGVGKGLWLGFWILCVVWPALLLYGLASSVGLERLGQVFSSVLPRRRESLLIVAWVFPSFVQGVAGFGAPIAVAAPLLLAMGWSKTRAVAYPLIGYHWSVTFGSMGSSFYMASLTSGFGPPAQANLAMRAAALLAVNCLLAGALVLALDGGWAGLREGAPLLLLVGLPMAATLFLVATVVPAVATLAAGAVGFAAVSVRAAVVRDRALARAGGGLAVSTDGHPVMAPGRGEGRCHPGLLLSPYGYLLAVALPVFLIPASREWVRSHLLVAFDFPATRTGLGWQNPATDAFTPLQLVGHPGFYILLACLLGYLTYRHAGLSPPGTARRVLRTWTRSLPAASASILILACLATVLVDTAMVWVLAQGTAAVTGGLFPALSPLLGALGSFMTGSTTSSNALLAALQRDIAAALGIAPPILVAAQTVGGNVGNSLAPVVVLVGASAVGAPELVPHILRRCLLPAALLLAVVTTITVGVTL